jgi:hypothetical protein
MTSPTRNRRARGNVGGTLLSYQLPKGAQRNLHIAYTTAEDEPSQVITADDSFNLAPSQALTPDEWVRMNLRSLERHEGRWLAVSGRGVVAIGDSLLEVRRVATEAGYARTDVIVFKIPSSSVKKAVSTRKR